MENALWKYSWLHSGELRIHRLKPELQIKTFKYLYDCKTKNIKANSHRGKNN